MRAKHSQGQVTNAVLGTAWNDLLDYVGRGNPRLQARDKFHAFSMLENHHHGHARNTTYRTPD